MKRALFWILLLSTASSFLAAQAPAPQQGSIVRMRMTPCPVPQHAFMMAMSGAARGQTDELCPEYTLVTGKVVYLIVGRSSAQLVPLAEVTNFRLLNRELSIRVDDANHETRFMIKEMMLRTEWDREQKLEEEEMRALARHEQETSLTVRDTR